MKEVFTTSTGDSNSPKVQDPERQRIVEMAAWIGAMEDALEIKRVEKRTGNYPAAAAKDFDTMISALARAVDEAWKRPDFAQQIESVRDKGKTDPALREIIAEYDLRTAVSSHDMVASKEIESRGREMHARAQKDNDWGIVAPWLTDVMDNQRAVGVSIAQRKGFKDPIDGMLAIWSPGFSAAQVDRYFEGLEPKLKELQRQALAQQKTAAPLEGPFPVEGQIELNRILAEKMGLDMTRGGLRYSGNAPIEGGTRNYAFANLRWPDPGTAFYTSAKSAVHEAAHQTYIQNLPEESQHTPLGRDLGGVAQESQALLMEMIIGRSRSASRYIAQEAGKIFGRDIDAEQLYTLRNQVTFAEDRKEADELTYHLHVIARWKAYKALFRGDVSAQDFPERLANIYEETVGIKTDDPVRLALHDVHYFNGKGALYPSYTLGHGIAAQLWSKIREDIPHVDESMEAGDFAPVSGWLTDKIHRHGRMHALEDLVLNATGQKPDPAFQIAHLQSRFAPGAASPDAVRGLTGPAPMA